MTKKCHPSMYNVITASGAITYGFRCAVHNIPSRRYSTEAMRNERLKEHQRDAKKDAK